jgi:hypothetical protein
MYDFNGDRMQSDESDDDDEGDEKNDLLVACNPSQKNKIILVLTSKFAVFSLE